jgi:hypothetical protein
MDDDGEMSLAQHRPRHLNRQLPMRFRDVLPQPPPTVPPEVRGFLQEPVGRVSTVERPVLPVHTVKFCTCPNVFGLVRQYFSSTPPSHNPEEYIMIADLSIMPTTIQVDQLPYEPPASSSDSQYHPYPNRSSFQLGDWYWNQGVQKSQGDYMKLMDILRSRSFSTEDVSSTN